MGDLITLEFNVDNLDGPGAWYAEGIMSFSASASGFGGNDLTGLQLVSGQSAAFYFVDICISFEICLGGLYGGFGPVDPQNLVQQANGNVSIIQASVAREVSESSPRFNDGIQDNGYDGTFNTSDVTLTFLVTGTVNGVEFGTQLAGDSAITPNGSFDVPSASYTINVIPEPGTAFLLGLGLAGLARRNQLCEDD
ncbi:MAG: PEP-CTERM sorting domain-containing protein [Myxococcota bacterium]